MERTDLQGSIKEQHRQGSLHPADSDMLTDKLSGKGYSQNRIDPAGQSRLSGEQTGADARESGKDDPLEEIRKAIKAYKEKEAYERKMRSRVEANDKYNPRCPKCGLRVLYCIYGYGPDKIEQYDRRGILYRRMGCFIPQNRYTYFCPDCYIGYDRKLRQISDQY